MHDILECTALYSLNSHFQMT